MLVDTKSEWASRKGGGGGNSLYEPFPSQATNQIAGFVFPLTDWEKKLLFIKEVDMISRRPQAEDGRGLVLSQEIDEKIYSIIIFLFNNLFRRVERGRIHLFRNRIYKKTSSIQNKALLFSRNNTVFIRNWKCKWLKLIRLSHSMQYSLFELSIATFSVQYFMNC